MIQVLYDLSPLDLSPLQPGSVLVACQNNNFFDASENSKGFNNIPKITLSRE